MCFEKQGNYGEAKPRQTGQTRRTRLERLATVAIVPVVPVVSDVSFDQERLDPLLYQRVNPIFQLAPLRGIGEDLGGNAPPFLWVGDQLVNNIVGVDCLDADFVKIASEKRFPAGYSAGKGNPHSALGAAFTSASSAVSLFTRSSRPEGVIKRPVTKMSKLRLSVCSAWLRKNRPT